MGIRLKCELWIGDLSTHRLHGSGLGRSAREIVDILYDTVRGYWLALERGTPGEVYNVGSGRTRTIASMLDVLLEHSSVDVEVRPDPSRMRPSDVKVLHADPAKFMAATGWQPRIPFEQTMRDLLEYWRSRVTGGKVWQLL